MRGSAGRRGPHNHQPGRFKAVAPALSFCRSRIGRPSFLDYQGAASQIIAIIS